jgi:hypothetical protein
MIENWKDEEDKLQGQLFTEPQAFKEAVKELVSVSHDL